MVEQGSGYAGIRRAAVGSATALLVLGSAVGAAVAGLPHGKHVQKAAIAHVFTPKKPIPPATDSGPAGGSGLGTDLPHAGSGSKPPPIAPETPHGTDSTSLPDTSSTGTGGGGTSGGGGGGGTKSTPAKKTPKKPEHRDRTVKTHGTPVPSLFATGEQPIAAKVFTTSGPSGASGADYTIDSLAKTAWTTKTNDRGVMVTPGPGTYKRIAVITETPNWSVDVYYSDKADPQSMGDWTFSSDGIADRRNRFAVRDAKHYLVLVADTGNKRVRINEVQLFQ
jgi:hypothetical protein